LAKPPRRALVVVNPKARRGGTALDAVWPILEQGGLTLRFEECRSRDHLTELILQARDADCVVIGGGDGAVNAAGQGVLMRHLPLGILPLGTANDLARTLGVPQDLVGAAKLIAKGKRRRIDVGFANGHPFFNVASLGLSVDLTRKLDTALKERLGQMSYAWTAMQMVTLARKFRAIIASPDGVVRVKTYQITVGNGRYFGGGVAVRHDAKIDDARLDLSSLELHGPWQLPLIAPFMRRGQHVWFNEVRDLTGQRFEVRTRRPRPVNLDGELLTHTPVVFEVRPRAVEVYVP